LLAKHPVKAVPLSAEEIALAGHISTYEVLLLSRMTDWRDVPVNLMQGYLRGCRVDFCDWRTMNRINAYRRKGMHFEYLRRSGNWSSYYEPLAKKYFLSLPK